MTTPKEHFTPSLYIKTDCPFSFKVVLFLQEAGLLGQFKVREYNTQSDQASTVKAELEALMGATASFPTIEVSEGRFKSESDDLIQYYADLHNINFHELPVLDLCTRGLFNTYTKMVKKIKASNNGVFEI